MNKSGLNKKVAGMPVWAWAALLGGTIGLVWLYQKGKKGTTVTPQSEEVAAGYPSVGPYGEGALPESAIPAEAAEELPGPSTFEELGELLGLIDLIKESFPGNKGKRKKPGKAKGGKGKGKGHKATQPKHKGKNKAAGKTGHDAVGSTGHGSAGHPKHRVGVGQAVAVAGPQHRSQHHKQAGNHRHRVNHSNRRRHR